MKRVLVIIIAMVLCFRLFAVGTSAAEAGISLSSTEGMPGEQVTVNVKISGNTGLAYLKLKISYDSGVLTLVKAQNTGLLGGTYTTSKTTDVNPYVLQWMGAGNSVGDGIIATLTFEISETAEAGDQIITLLFEECYDEEFNDVEFTPTDGVVTVVAPSCPHNTKTEVPSKSANCVNSGNNLYFVCDSCGLVFKADGITETTVEAETIPALGHDYKAVVTEPTCEEGGYTTYTCSVCGHSYVGDYTDPVDHVYEDGACIWCGDVKKVYTVTWVEAYSSLGGNIAVVFKADLSKDLAEDPDAFMRFTYAGKTVDIPVSEAARAGSYYNFFCRITSVNMTDDITAQMMVGEEAIGRSVTTSLEKYCSYIAASSKDEKTVNLMKAMLNYGAAAQKMMNYKTDNLANKSLSDANKVLTAVDASAFAHSIVGTEGGIKPVEALLVLGSETTIRVGFQLTGNKSIEEYTFTVDGVEVRPEYKGGKYVLEVPDIAAHLLDEYHTFTCGDITITYCGLSYVNQVMSYYTEGTTFDMAVALYNYSQATEAYTN